MYLQIGIFGFEQKSPSKKMISCNCKLQVAELMLKFNFTKADLGVENYQNVAF